MISFVRGELASIGESRIEIDTGAIGYEINVPTSVLDELPSVGSTVRIYTYMNVREDEMSLFGFLSRDALEMFKLLITVNGIGPKAALGILSVLSPADLRFAIIAGDVKAVSKAPGVGSKTAQRVIMELKDKVSLEDGFAAIADDGPKSVKREDMTAKGEAIAALTALGYSDSDALKAVQGIDTTGMTTEDILKEALKRTGL